MNSNHRTGRTMIAWENKPFYWLAPDGRQKVLCWIPYRGYQPQVSLDSTWNGDLSGASLPQLERSGYPYDIVQLQWCIGSDNGAAGAALPDLVKKLERRACISEAGHRHDERTLS